MHELILHSSGRITWQMQMKPKATANGFARNLNLATTEKRTRNSESDIPNGPSQDEDRFYAQSCKPGYQAAYDRCKDADSHSSSGLQKEPCYPQTSIANYLCHRKLLSFKRQVE
jgi:hypothetical protein